MGRRRDRLDTRLADQKKARQVNGIWKKKENTRRDARIIETIKADGDLPYAPHVMSWLSRKLDKPSTKIQQEEVKALLS